MTDREPTSQNEGRTLSSIEDLQRRGLLEPGEAALAAVASRYAIGVSEDMAHLINPSQPDDPIARQFVPNERELTVADDEISDPIGDAAHSPLPGLVHRYPDRVLLKPTHVCPVYCRFCFRRERVGPGQSPSLTGEDLTNAFDYIRAHPEIWEVIVTGGDPLLLSARRVRDIGQALSGIPHVRVVRWHTRVPVVTPRAVTPELASALAIPIANDRMTYVSIHTNHVRELTETADQAISALRRAGIALVSQTVLLRGVNDSAAALADLFRALVARGVMPYYLHHLDRAPGTSHFRVPLHEAKDIVHQLRGHISGLCQPTFVVDLPGGYGKVPVSHGENAAAPANNTGPETGDVFSFRDRNGRLHRYTE